MKFEFDCRQTGMGAYTTAGGRAYGHSKTGAHWQEEVEANEGDLIHLTDISNSGHHNCVTYQVVHGDLVVVENGNDRDCPVCAARKTV